MTSFLPAQLRYFPLISVMSFLLTTILLFFLGPYNWPIENYELLALFLTAVMVAIVSGYAIGVTAPARAGILPKWKWFYVAGAISTCVMVFPNAYVYTGKFPWEVFSFSFDQGQAYLDFLARVQELDGQRGPIVVARTLTQWLVLTVIPLAVLRWRHLDFTMRLLLAGSVLSAAVFSLLRGTDQGTFDLGFFFATSILIAIARNCMQTDRSIIWFLRTRRGAVVMMAASVFLVFAFQMFVERKTQRYDGQIASLCIGEELQVCVNPMHPIAAHMDDRGRFAFGMVTAYASQGYYGLALSLDRDFETTLGVGHSSALTRVYEAITQDQEFYKRSFTYRLRQDAWSDLYMWSSIYTWIANDVGFLMTIPIIGLLAWLWGSAWRDAVRGDSDAAAIVFVLMTQTFMYSPANFQIALVTETYAAFLIWLFIWYKTTKKIQSR